MAHVANDECRKVEKMTTGVWKWLLCDGFYLDLTIPISLRKLCEEMVLNCMNEFLARGGEGQIYNISRRTGSGMGWTSLIPRSGASTRCFRVLSPKAFWSHYPGSCSGSSERYWDPWMPRQYYSIESKALLLAILAFAILWSLRARLESFLALNTQ